MKKLLVVLCLLISTGKLFAQDFSQYNTGTLFDSFENPAQKTFIPDTSRKFASNFFIPNFSGNFFLTGDGQQTLKTRLVHNFYDNAALQTGAGKFNHVNGDFNVYIFMLKIYTSLDGDAEVGVFAQAKAEGTGTFSDDFIALFNGSPSFPNNSYVNNITANFHYQAYYQYGVTYREQITKRFALGFKLAYVSGITNQSMTVDQSAVNFDKVADTASLYLKGVHHIASPTLNPFNNPGASLSVGTTYKTRDGFLLQANIKDLGFIHWSANARYYNFNDTAGIYGLTSGERENSYVAALKEATTNSAAYKGYTTPLDGRAEISASKSYWLDDDYTVNYSPTLIASKELFYNGFTAALVNPVRYGKYTVSIITEYDDMRLFNLGAQFMIKTPNAEFFIGSDRLYQSANVVAAALGHESQIATIGSYTGADITFGATFKFGPVIEHPMNASHIPMGDDDKGFLGKFFQKIFNPNAGQLKNN